MFVQITKWLAGYKSVTYYYYYYLRQGGYVFALVSLFVCVCV